MVKEQYYICCYCNDSIKGEALDTKIEHFLPKDTHKDKAFHYPNLLAACNGGERQKPVVLSCDSIKKNENPLDYNIISPFDVDAHLHFSYKENGEIKGKTEQGKNTITFLNLDCKRLQFDTDILNLFCHSELAKNLTSLRQKPIIQILRKLRMTNLKCQYQN